MGAIMSYLQRNQNNINSGFKLNEIKERCGIYNVFYDIEECSQCGHETRWLHYELNTCSNCTIKYFEDKEI